MKTKNLIVFDIDGTLTDSVKIHQKAFAEMLFEIGVEKINSEFQSFKHHTDSFIAKEIYETTLDMPMSEAKRIEFEKGLTKKISRQEINEITGAKQLIGVLENETDFGVCYATGSLRRPALHKLRSIEVEFNKKQLVASDLIFERENIVENAIRNAMEYYTVENFDRIIAVGDGLWDLLTARNLGLEFIGIGVANKEALIHNGAKIVYEDLSEFKV